MESVLWVTSLMTNKKLITDAFDVLTISLVSVTALPALLCIYCSLYFQLKIRRRGSHQLSYFNRPWIIRLVLIIAALWWGFGEIVRLSFVRRRVRLFSSLRFQKEICNFYILSNLGFAEPTMLLMLAFLLHAALQKADSGTLSRRWNWRTVGCFLLFCLPLFMMQLVVILAGHKFSSDENNRTTKMVKLFTTTSYLDEDMIICTYPLISATILGSFVALVIIYIISVGFRMWSLIINKRLRRRFYLLIFSDGIFLILRVFLLGFSVVPHPGSLVHEVIVFSAFLVQLFCTVVGICMLVYLPLRDSMSLRDVGLVEINATPYDDYYSEGISLIDNQSHLETGMNLDLLVKPGSVVFAPCKDEI